MWGNIIARQSLSNTFDKIIRLEIGRWLAGSSNERPGFLNIVTLTNLKDEGKVPVEKDRLAMLAMMGAQRVW